MKSEKTLILVVLSDHDRRVRIRKICEDECGLTVYSAANPLEALSLLSKIKLPSCILLSNQLMHLMTHLEFLERLAGDPRWAAIPVLLLTESEVAALPSGVAEALNMSASLARPNPEDDLRRLIRQYCGQSET